MTAKVDIDIEEFRKCCESGKYSKKALAVLFDIGETTVGRTIKRNGINYVKKVSGCPKSIIIDKEELCSLYQTNSLAEIADIYGVGETTIFSRVKEFGIVIKSPKTKRQRFRKQQSKRITSINKGSKSPLWKGGDAARPSRGGSHKKDVIVWRTRALEKAKYTCETCGITQAELVESLHVHHPKGWREYPELRLDDSNSMVLCRKCHAEEHKG